MKKSTLILIALELSIGMTLSPVTVLAKDTSTFSSQTLPSLAPMLEKVMPSVVSITVEGKNKAKIIQIPDPFQQFFGENSIFCQHGSPFHNSSMCKNHHNKKKKVTPSTKQFHALGSGVVIDSEKGYVITNNHVVDHASKIQVQLNDGRTFNAQIIGKDPQSDIALIQLEHAKNLIAINIIKSDNLHVGDYTVAIGNPYGLGQTVTAGIISGLGRNGLNVEHYENFIQTDAAINRGNSGGALVNLNGELIGINTAILAPDGGNIGIGFAIPITMVKNLIWQMIKFGQVKHGTLGVLGSELNTALAKVMNVKAQHGAFISRVLPNSAASKAGIKPGDVVINMNDKPLDSFAALRAEVGSLPAGTKLHLGFIRRGKLSNVIVELQPKSVTDKKQLPSQSPSQSPSQVPSQSFFQSSSMSYPGLEGAELSNLDNDGSHQGIHVDQVKPDTAASHLGLEKDDIIYQVNQQKIGNLSDLIKIINTKPDILVLDIQRGNSELYLLAMMH